MRVLRAGARAGAWTFGLLAAVLIPLTLLPFFTGSGDGANDPSLLAAIGWSLAITVGLAGPLALIVAIARGSWDLVLDETRRKHVEAARDLEGR